MTQPAISPTEVRGPITGCWEWTGSVNKYGYGRAHVPGTKQAVALVHRMVYTAIYDDEPPEVMHRCDNPRCFRPDHLIGGTHAENMADMVAKRRHGRHSNETCHRGHAYDRIGHHGERRCSTCDNATSRRTKQRRRDRERAL